MTGKGKGSVGELEEGVRLRQGAIKVYFFTYLISVSPLIKFVAFDGSGDVLREYASWTLERGGLQTI